ncbi:hypothetical protein Phum_PHUM173680 [Pediculus humanus corporis]|uniref:Uncharacterized protein n=1 Tax=Pediculus humanus subsp. corporis TaxID=121224 RepID=E0VG55_PEDHC|nr:uncharacterized protein Phum_PHUM173680 [Pediculus humanus corporis]EEB12361.1 hypothetical protein Phum_PHUM173680 [Pediculus humanus corporis]
MNIQKLKDLDTETKLLKVLMREINKNQIELSKMLVEKKVYSQSIIKLLDPNVLEEENKTVKKITEMEVAKKNTSAKSLQLKVNELKQKCTIKNRMIVALLKSLKSNVPKEWLENLVDGLFNESKPIEEFDSDKVNEFVRQTSLYLMKEELV